LNWQRKPARPRAIEGVARWKRFDAIKDGEVYSRHQIGAEQRKTEFAIAVCVDGVKFFASADLFNADAIQLMEAELLAAIEKSLARGLEH
jgi:hypothetical protein